MTDIQNRGDIELLMNQFYNQALKDEVIGYIFTDVAQLNLNAHLPIICDFWESVILKTGSYKSNVLDIHLKLNELSPLKAHHFNQWLALLNKTVDTNFSGVNAEQMKIRAQSIATVMQVKINKV